MTRAQEIADLTRAQQAINAARQASVNHRQAVSEETKEMNAAKRAAEEWAKAHQELVQDLGKATLAFANHMAEWSKQFDVPEPTFNLSASIQKSEAALSNFLEHHGPMKEITDDLARQKDLWDEIGKSVDDAASRMESAFGRAGGAIGDAVKTLTSYARKQAEIAEAQRAANGDQEKLGHIAKQSASLQVETYGDMAAAAKGFFREGSAGWKALQMAEQAYRAVQLAMSIASMVQGTAETASHVANSAVQATADGTAGIAKQSQLPFPFNIAAMAATAVALVAAGVAVFGGGGGGSSAAAPTSAADLQKAAGTGTVLGSPNDKSASIAHSLDLVAKNTGDDLGVANAMLTSLKAINTSIVAMAATVGKQIAVSGALGDTSGLNLGSSGSAGFLGMFASSTTRSLYDAGITLAATTVGDIVANGIAGQTYQIVEQVKKKSGFLGIGGGTKTSYNTTTGALPSDISASIQSVIGALENGIVTAAGTIGVDGAKAMLDGFQVDIGKLSFDGLDAQGIQDQLNAVFSSVGDKMVEAILPGIEKFQLAGEGLFETLERVASTTVAVDAEMAKLGTSATGLGVDIDMGIASHFDTVSDFTSAADAYFKSYYSAAEQTAARTSQLAKVFDTLGLAMPDTTASFRALVDAQDLTTAAGQQAYATLLQIAPAFADLKKAVDDTAVSAKSAADILSERRDLEKQLMQAQGDTAGLRALELAALDPSNRALQQRLYDLADEKTATDAAAQAAATLAQAEQAIAQQRAGLMQQLWQQTGDTAAIRAAQVAGLDESNRALQLQIYALQDAAAATQAAAAAEKAIADQRAGLMQQLLEAQGDTAAIRAGQLAGIDESNRAIQLQIWALQDQATATQAAAAAAEASAQAEAAVAQQRAGLMQTLWQLTGDTASGTFTDWTISLTPPETVAAATLLEMLAFASNNVAATPANLIAAALSRPLTYASTITPDLGQSLNFHLTLAGNATLANPANLIPGQSGRIRLVQDGTGSRLLTFGGKWQFFPNVAPTLSTAAGMADLLQYYVHDTSTIECALVRGS